MTEPIVEQVAASDDAGRDVFLISVRWKLPGSDVLGLRSFKTQDGEQMTPIDDAKGVFQALTSRRRFTVKNWPLP